MRNIIVLATIFTMAANPAAMAEDNADLLRASYQGAVTGDPEKDTVAYDLGQPSDLWVRFSPECFTGTAAGQHAGRSATSGEIRQAAR